MTLGERIKEQRQKLGFSQEKIAELVGTSRQAVTKWETNQSIPCMDNLMTLADIFGISLSELSKGTKENNQIENASVENEQAYPQKRILVLDVLFVFVLAFAAWNIIKIPAIIGYSVLGFMTIVLQAAVILYVPLYLLWIRPRQKSKSYIKKGEAVMSKNTKASRIAWISSSTVVLILCFLLCRYSLFGLHGNKDLPLVLFIVGLIILGISSIFDMRKIMIFTVIGYIGGFALGLIFGVDGVDPGGGSTNNWWVIWIASFVALLIIGEVWEVFIRYAQKKL